MKAGELMAKADRAIASARLLLDAGDVDGACNRSYYAMFDAARAALMQSDAPVLPEVVKTHSGLISAFSLHFVKTGKIPIDLGKTLNKAAELRLIADYTGDVVTAELAEWMVEHALVFVEAIRRELMPTNN